MRRSPLRFVVTPLGLVLVAVGVYALARGGVGGALGLLTGLALIGLGTFDAPPSSPAAARARTEDPIAPRSSRERTMDRLIVAAMIVTLGGASLVTVFVDVASWYSGPAAIVLFMLLTTGAVAWGLREPYWVVFRRGITSFRERD